MLKAKGRLLEASFQSKLVEFYQKRQESLQASKLALDCIDSTPVFDTALDCKQHSLIMIVGEAPGENEVKEQRPFVGLAGKNLTESIKKSGLCREKDFLITNAFPFRTYEHSSKGVKNRTPNLKELEFGAKLLLEEISIVRPKLILLLGGSAKKAFLKIEDSSAKQIVKTMDNHSIDKCYFSSIDYHCKIGLSFHPSPLVYNTKDKRETLWEFFKNLVTIA